MSAASTSRTIVRSRSLAALTLCASAVALSNLVSPGASATLSHTATKIKSVVVTGVAGPAGAPNNPAAVIVADTDFSVTVTFSDKFGHELPPSFTKPSTVTLSVQPPVGEPPSEAGDAQFVGATTLIVPPGASSATGSGFRLSPADNRIRIGAKITAGSTAAKAIPRGFSAQFDVVSSAVVVGPEATFVSTSGDASDCVVTSHEPYCVDIRLPFGTQTGAVLTVGECDAFLGCSSPDQVVVQFLADLGPQYSRTNPAVAVYKCDKTACYGGEVTKYHVFVSLAATGPLAKAPACAAKGVVDANLDFCVDYRQSKRDHLTGDVKLFLLLARDARMSCC